MESLLVGKSRQTVLHAVKSLLPVLLKHWGHPEAFQQEAADPLMGALGSANTSPKDVGTLAAHIYRVVAQIHALQTRHITSQQALSQTQKTLEPTFAASPLRQGCLWLAIRARQEALSRLNTPEGKTAYGRVVMGLDGQRITVSRKFKATEALTLELLEAGLANLAHGILGETKDSFLLAAIAGEIVEKARKQARLHPSETAVPADFSDNSPETRIISALEEPARNAELNEAHQRFSALNDYQKGARYEALRKVMQKHIDRIAPYAPEGFEVFCQAVESIAFPYPAPLEWVRVFLKPLYANARQSTTFDKCLTEQSINYRYQKIQEERGVNPIMLELARAFTLATLKTAQKESVKHFLYEVNLVGEFHWPADLDELKTQLQR